MAVKANFLSLPAELREQILHHYFRVDGGYAYDADSDCLKTAVDNRPIDLALLYTCRTIANEAMHLPLSLNTIKFTTLYRRDLNKLAGCFNFVTGLYHHLQADFLLQLANFLTSEMRAELALEYPNFDAHLANALRVRGQRVEELQSRYEGLHENHARQLRSTARDCNGTSATVGARVHLRHQMEDALCLSAKAFLSEPFFFEDRFLSLSGPSDDTRAYIGFSNLPYDIHMDWKELARSFWKVERFFSHALNLLAKHNPSEFSRRVFTAFPEWLGRYSAQEFLNMRFDHWAIPSQSQVRHATDLLSINNIWDDPDMWHGPPDDDGTSGVRCRQKIRFSAAANAIRFLKTRISHKHRPDIRTLILHEDLPSVNVPSAHSQGLAPFFRENPLLRVERRVDMMRCMYGAFDNAKYVARHFLNPDAWPETRLVQAEDFGPQISRWLTDALAVTRVGIPAESFTLVLEAGSYRDYFADTFQQRLHKEMAWCRALKYLVQNDAFGPAGHHLPLNRSMQYMITCEDADAIESLANETSPILRSDFNAGISMDVDTLINETRSLTIDRWIYEWCSALVPWRPLQEQPTYQVDYKVRLADNYEIEIDQ